VSGEFCLIKTTRNFTTNLQDFYSRYLLRIETFRRRYMVYWYSFKMIKISIIDWFNTVCVCVDLISVPYCSVENSIHILGWNGMIIGFRWTLILLTHNRRWKRYFNACCSNCFQAENGSSFWFFWCARTSSHRGDLEPSPPPSLIRLLCEFFLRLIFVKMYAPSYLSGLLLTSLIYFANQYKAGITFWEQGL